MNSTTMAHLQAHVTTREQHTVTNSSLKICLLAKAKNSYREQHTTAVSTNDKIINSPFLCPYIYM